MLQTLNNSPTNSGQIYPDIVFPYRFPKDISGLELLYETLRNITQSQPGKYARPLTVINHQTIAFNSKNREFQQLIKNVVSPCSDIIKIWSVDSCATWYSLLGESFRRSKEKGNGHDDVLWLIPGDFDYASFEGRKSLKAMVQIPEKVYDPNSNIDLCLGEIDVPLNSSKSLIDEYGTFGLLYNWFPTYGKAIRAITNKPRSEFFAISRSYLEQVLVERRWYPYEQTLVILLEAFGIDGRTVRKVETVNLGCIKDDASNRDSLSGAMQQIDRMARLLADFWREVYSHLNPAHWLERYKILDAQAQAIKSSALVILEQCLKQG